jgi:hypothetical protein
MCFCRDCMTWLLCAGKSENVSFLWLDHLL